MKTIVLALAMTLIAMTSQAGEIQLSVAKTIHLGTDTKFDEVHPTIRYSENSLFIGAYHNSEGNTSGVAGQRLENPSGLFIEYGIITGYSTEPILPMVRIGQQVGILSVFIAPAAELTINGIKPLLVLGVEFNLYKSNI